MKRAVALLTGPRCAALSGVSTHVELLLRSELARDFTLIHFEVGREGRDEGLAGRVLRLLVSPLRLAWQLLTRRVAIVHLNTALTLRAYWRDLAYMLVARLCRARVLCQIHGGPAPEAFVRGRRLAAAFVRATLGLADVIVVLSSADREAFCRFGVAAPVLALPNAVDCAPYDALVHEPAAPARPLRVLYLGRLVREKGLYELIEGLALARAQGAAAELIVAGEGPEAAALGAVAAAGGLAPVGFVGPVRGADKLALLSWADVLALPSYSEGLPYALLEGMAAGVPPIATRVGAIPEVVADGVNGLLLEPRSPQAIATALHALGRDRDALARMGAASRATISTRYSIDGLAAQLRALYASLEARGRGHDVARA
ncbi:MAG TPA: glycosyltransferase family 4 protein [Steroidobacteraceae bacterium]|nr:glycosyltransferase family 4 protein [Steroidobacteraceae bacterium]